MPRVPIPKRIRQKNDEKQSSAKKPSWQMSVAEFNKNGCLINGD